MAICDEDRDDDDNHYNVVCVYVCGGGQAHKPRSYASSKLRVTY